jgi:predicted AAA+ superfamily ATPase
MLKGKSILENATALGEATETAVFKHLYARHYSQSVRFTYWRGNKDREVDLVAEFGATIVPFEVKYRSQHTEARDLKGLKELCQNKMLQRGYVVTKELTDFGLLEELSNDTTKIMQIPAALLCYWVGQSELAQYDDLHEIV